MRKLIVFLALSGVVFADLPDVISSKKSMFTVYTESPETQRMGYGNWNPYEDGELLIIKSFIRQGDTVIDAGAHVGDWSRLVLEHTENNCNLYSFEPVPYFFEKLTKALGSKVHAYNVALGNIEMLTTMNYYYQESEGCSSLFDRRELSSIPVKKINISVTHLDKFCADNGINYIDFLKIDTEGSEWKVLQGASNLISGRKISTIQFEYGGTYPDANITLQQVYIYLVSKGYAIFRITSDGLIHITQWQKELENYHLSNYLAVLND